ncbi:MAG: hypothetical protein COX65_03125 [Elusimicrobia bacterium CG_4_10_14_0_2_um_filter_56_8]|nr:MAG: hypothetical protein AUJ51_02500 [Elusimicrobia bacterium CG1_02_56_21]PJA16188.1 MAG: hypothetical protein COX65_03125 [Elusimicrobia bacterium CG_4_10_14_0_2_um_filter_56_8]
MKSAKQNINQRGDACLDLLRALPKEELVKIIVDDAKNWLAHDGLWFQAVEGLHGMEDAIKADALAWEKFTVIEARRIMERLGIASGGGLAALGQCLKHRFYARLNTQKYEILSEKKAVFHMLDCRVQSARKRKGLPDFPCKSVGIVEYSGFARAVDPRIETRCLACPPDKHPEDFYCGWEFTIAG